MLRFQYSYTAIIIIIIITNNSKLEELTLPCPPQEEGI